MSKGLHDQVLDALRNRQPWENKQLAFYTMRHDGLRRLKKPFPGASDLHFPLVDGQIEKAKPFYFGQLFSGQRIAEFEAESAETAATADLAADYFDHYLKNELPYGQKVLSATDTMLVRGRGILKHYWDVESGKIKVECVDPQYFVVPQHGVGPDEDDWFVHVKNVSVAWYKRQRVYDQTPETIERIRGGTQNNEFSVEVDDEKFRREGLTHTRDEQRIIIWECWEKTSGGWTIYEYSPQAPELMLRKPRGCPYKWRGKPWQPFVSMFKEIKDDGWYAPRGIAEQLYPFEVSLTRLWNEKHDSMSFFNRPLFSRDETASPNTLNFRFRPGEVLPKGIQPVQMPNPPLSADQEMQFQRLVAADYINLPDAGTMPDVAKGSGESHKTARQVSYEASLQTAATNLRGWVFRECLSQSLWRVWALMVQYQNTAESLSYFAKGRNVVVPQQAFSDLYRIKPGGAIEGWDRQLKYMKAVQRKQLFMGDPTINQEELNRMVLQEDDAQLVDRLIIPSGLKDASEAEDEAKEILVLMSGMPVVAMPNENHALRLKILLGKLQQLGLKGVPVDEQARALMEQHIQMHLQMLKQQNPKLAQGAIAAINMMSGPQAMPPAVMEMRVA